MADITYVSQEGVGLGWKPDLPDYRDYIFGDRSAKLMRTRKQLAEIQRRQTPSAALLGPRRDQHAEGSCTGHGVGSAANRITRQDGDRYNTVYSPRFAYNLARVMEGCAKNPDGSPKLSADGSFADPGPWIKVDGGAYVRDAVLGARKFGIPPESSWRYRASIREGDRSLGWDDYKKVPTPSRFKAAHRFRFEAQRCSTVEEILSALAAGCPVVFGFSCFTNMWTQEVDRTGAMPMPAGSEDGGHCVCAHWYDLDADVLDFENSWSDRWAVSSHSGIAGVGTLPLEYARRGWADDHWAIVKEAL